MHDLRRQALESNKTVSRKAKARSSQSSPANSRSNSAPPSRSASRVASRHGSDEEDGGNLSDETSFSVNSIDEMLSAESPEVSTDAWISELADRIEEIINRKRSSVQGRETCLATYVRILTAHYAEEEIRGKEAELVTACLKSIKTESSEKEAVLAMKALAMTLITSPSDQIYEAACNPLKRTISDSSSIACKVAAIHTLGACTFYGGASDDEILDNMAYLLEIIASDGHFIEAPDAPDPVTAALEEWGFLATLIDDLSEDSDEAIATFVDQLESSHPSVQISAGENIALLYEKSYIPISDEDALADHPNATIVEDPDEDADLAKLAHIYSAYRRTDTLLLTLASISTTNSHRLSKKDQKALRTSFADIHNSVEFPARGPRYRTAVSNQTGKTYGSRMVIRIHQEGVVRIDKWWKLHRLQGLRRVLQGGFLGHYERNGVVFESLPVMVSRDKNWG